MSDKLSSSQVAVLQHLGLDVYTPLVALKVDTLPWIESLCAYLKISTEQVEYGESKPLFDEANQKLHLPKISYQSEIQFKRQIWQAIQTVSRHA